MSLLLVALPISAVAETYLLMAEEEGCIYCARWNAEVGDAYHKTEEGAAAPLHRVDVKADVSDLQLARPLHFTPTFVLIRDGVELSRIEGYPGEDFFWGLLDRMLEDAGEDLSDHAG
ncbi:hypothetical protein ACRARG_08895 [Pseudooceanicola sp. C21-150M6]|uniref:hypothetical protein n=1 Tax=Pseudooceanicola sp. C21-150M6 TaxID=3434355 RepID=UPI003D7FF200